MVPYLLSCARSTRAPLLPLAALCFALLGIFADQRNEVGATWGLAAVLSSGLAAWLVGAVVGTEPPEQADMATAALGGRRGRARLEVALALLTATLFALAFLAVPLTLIAAHVGTVFERPISIGDVAAASLAIWCSGLFGAALALAFGPPRVTHRATTFALTLGVLLLFAAASGTLGAAGGPVAVARALTDAPPRRITSAAALASFACLVWSAAIGGAVRILSGSRR